MTTKLMRQVDRRRTEVVPTNSYIRYCTLYMTLFITAMWIIINVLKGILIIVYTERVFHFELRSEEETK